MNEDDDALPRRCCGVTTAARVWAADPSCWLTRQDPPLVHFFAVAGQSTYLLPFVLDRDLQRNSLPPRLHHHHPCEPRRDTIAVCLRRTHPSGMESSRATVNSAVCMWNDAGQGDTVHQGGFTAHNRWWCCCAEVGISKTSFRHDTPGCVRALKMNEATWKGSFYSVEAHFLAKKDTTSIIA